jgi:uncharacterized protein
MIYSTLSKLATIGAVAAILWSWSVSAQERLTMGATFSASSFFAYQVGIASYLNNVLTDTTINVRELGGAEVSTEALLRGEINMGIAVTSSDYAAMNGTDPFGEPAEQLRTLYYFAPLPMNFVVAEDSGIESIDQLSGKNFSPGGRGTSTERQAEQVFATLGIQPDFHRAEGDDALNAYQNGQIDGFIKTGLHPDGYIQQANSSRTVRFLTINDEQSEQVTKSVPFFSITKLSTGGSYGRDPQELNTIQTVIGINTTEDLPEDVAYEIAKAIFSKDGRQAAADAYPPVKDIDPMDLTIEAAVAPLHRGVVRYLREIGHEVPERLVPSGAQ